MRKHIPLIFGFMAVLAMVSSNAFANSDANDEDNQMIQSASVAPDGYLVIGHHHLRRVVDARLEVCIAGVKEGNKSTCTDWLPLADYVPHKLGKNARYVGLGVKEDRWRDEVKLFLFYRVEK